jgi:hypothetical protein
MTVQYVVATGFTLVFLMLIANLLVDLYARGVVREAMDEGARAAVPVDVAPGACEARAREVLDGLLHGPLGDTIAVTCDLGPQRVRAHATVTLRSWMPALLPAWDFSVEASARRAT